MTLKLPTSPDGAQYEDLVVAGLRALGYFVEPSLILREGSKEILELDVVATPSDGSVADRVLFEAKKEKLSFSNLFKLFGQRSYLEIDRAVLVSQQGADQAYLPVYQAKGDELGVGVCHLPADPTLVVRLAPQRNGLTDEEVPLVARVSWYQQIARRMALSALVTECNARRGDPTCEAVRTYLFNVRSSFFQPTPLARAEALYSAYLNSPKLSGACLEIIRAALSLDEKAAWNAVSDTDGHLWVQGVMALEGAARLTIIKNALDDHVLRGGAPPPTVSWKIGSLTFDVPRHDIPMSFHAGLEAMRKHPHAAKLPYLFQSFADVLGGFLMPDDEEEMAFIERMTGVPSADIMPAIELLDRFFAPGGGSFLYQNKYGMRCLKMTPGFMRGGGCFLRQRLYGLTSYAPRYKGYDWLMGKWHNATYAVLEPALAAA